MPARVGGIVGWNEGNDDGVYVHIFGGLVGVDVVGVGVVDVVDVDVVYIGDRVGLCVVGDIAGDDEGCIDGISVGDIDGWYVGVIVGVIDGLLVIGLDVGDAIVGAGDGSAVGAAYGAILDGHWGPTHSNPAASLVLIVMSVPQLMQVTLHGAPDSQLISILPEQASLPLQNT